MKAQQALETQPAEKPIFVEAEKLINRMEELTKNVAHRAYEFFEERGRRFGNELEDWFRAESELMRYVPTTLKEGDQQFTFQAEVPGFKAEEIKISAEPKMLIIEGESEQSTEEKSDKVVFSERRTNHFCRSFSLPAEIDPAKVTANLKNGLLEIILPKVPVRQPVGVEIKTV
ncbi:MAG: Hsp20 family protein [Acidobacteriota bacterium]|nr:Hsp20 family protein [Acidobacteriota bacterium]